MVEILLGREYIGAGTVVNAVFLGYFVTFFNYVWSAFGIVPAVLWQQVVTVLIGVIICSFGLSLYQTSDAGVAPYDSLALIMQDVYKRQHPSRFPIPISRWCLRIPMERCV